MKTKLISAIVALLSFSAFAEVPKGVDKKWDSTLTVQVVRSTSTSKTIRVSAKAPAGGPLEVSVSGNGKFNVPAGKTATKQFTVKQSYVAKAYYKGKLLDSETNSRKTGLGTNGVRLNGGGLGEKRKFGQ